MDTSATIENFFWASIVMKAMPTAGDARKANLKRRFDAECKQYVVLSLAEMLHQPTGHIYHGSSDELLEEVVGKVRAVRDEL